MEKSLRDMLKHGRRFERLRTDEPGVFIRKVPRSKNDPAHLAVEINPIGRSGNPMYKVGALIRNQSELDAIREIVSRERVDEMLQKVERVNHQESD
ncbi:MAG: hypothetical protein JSW05_12875 [Candidatus Thorarchaeota archaeon]|nr:MAG: hypothetical protein JSW05_12875 [Candidatus Thorarchaeota archaeon]